MDQYRILFTLLVLFQVKHFLADYPLQTPYMLQKFKPDWGFFWPLYLHVWVHGFITFWITFAFTKNAEFAIKLYLIDGIIHFFMDRIKAGPKYLGRFKDMMDKKFWWSLGIDQMVHHLTHYLIIFLIVKKMN